MSLLSILFLFIIPFVSEPTIEKIEDKEIVLLFHSLENDNIYSNDIIHLSLFKKSNPPGSAGIPGSHEIDHSFYLAISEYDEYPNRSLFLIGGFINPEYEVEILKDYLRLSIKYGVYNDRRTVQYKITLAGVVLINP